MSFNITGFREAMRYDGQRPNLFDVTITTKGNIFSGEGLNMFAKGTSIPGSTMGVVIVPYFGREVKFAGNRTFAEWTVTVINDENFAIRSQLEKWMNSINKHNENVREAGLENSDDYTSQALVKQYSKDGSTGIIYTFQNIFPTDISEITLDWGDNDSIEEYTCTFAYDYWTRTSPNKTAGTGTVADELSI